MSSVTNGSHRAPKVRADGQGSVYQRTNDGLWVATVPSRYTASQSIKCFTSKFRDVAELKRHLWCKRQGVILKPDTMIHEIDEWIDVILEYLEPIIDEKIRRAIALSSQGRMQ
jgi:hypothetical protein